MIDDRFQQQQSLKNNLSKWVRDSLREYASYEACQQSLQAFFKRRETQPNPSTAPPLQESSALTAGIGGGGEGEEETEEEAVEAAEAVEEEDAGAGDREQEARSTDRGTRT